MAFTGTEKSLAKISNLKANNLLLSDNSIPVNVNFDTNDSLASYFQLLVDKINELEQKLEETTTISQTGCIHAFAGNAFNQETLSFYPPPLGYDWCFGQIVSKTDEKYSSLYSVIGDYWNTSSELTEDQFQLPDLRNVFLRGCPEYVESSENNRDIGSFQACGAPEIWAIATPTADWADTIQANFSGALKYQTGQRLGAGATDYQTNVSKGFDFYASRCSSVYQDGLTEVRPDNKAVNYIIKL